MNAPDKNPSQLAGHTAHPTTESAVASAAAPELIGLVPHEDVDRARDRWEVARARVKGRTKTFGGFRFLWVLVGPGILVFLGENDAPSMLSYSADGSRYGVGFFIPFVVLTFIMGFIVQEMTVRLGAVTHRGHAELIFDRFGKFWGFFAMGDLIFGNFLTLVTEFIGVRAGLGFFGVRPAIAVGGALVIVVAAITTGRYWTWERITLSLPVTPLILFFQQSAVMDKGMQPRDINAGRFDTLLGALLASAFAIAAILATVPLFHHGINAADFQAAQFAEALEPLIGHTGAALFALGIFEAGIVAAIAISTSSAYAFGEVMQTGHSLNRPLREAWPFYLTLFGSACAAAALVLIPRFPLEFVVLTVNVIAVLAMPPALAFLLLLVNDPEVMGEHVNGFWANVAGVTVTILLIIAGLGFGLATVFPKWLGG